MWQYNSNTCHRFLGKLGMVWSVQQDFGLKQIWHVCFDAHGKVINPYQKGVDLGSLVRVEKGWPTNFISPAPHASPQQVLARHQVSVRDVQDKTQNQKHDSQVCIKFEKTRNTPKKNTKTIQDCTCPCTISPFPTLPLPLSST